MVQKLSLHENWWLGTQFASQAENDDDKGNDNDN